MRLSFLGQSYEAINPAIEATTTQETITFLGRRSVVKQYSVTQRHQPAQELTYRGQHYLR